MARLRVAVNGNSAAFSEIEDTNVELSEQFAQDISINASEGDVVSRQRVGDDLIIELSNGETIRIEGFFANLPEGEHRLYSSESGTASQVLIDDATPQSIPSELIFSESAQIAAVVAGARTDLSTLVGAGAGVAGAGLIAVAEGAGGDTTPPVPPTVEIGNQSQISGGNAEIGARIFVSYTDPGAPGETVVIEAVNNGDGAWVLSPHEIPNGVILSVFQTDEAGNESDPAEFGPLDTIAPETPAAPVDYADDQGEIQDANSTAETTDDTQPGINIGSGLTDTPTLFVDGVLVASTYDAEAGTLTPNEPVGEGEHAFTYSLTDAAGNESGQSEPITIVIDTTPPEMPSAPVDYADDQGEIQNATSTAPTTDDTQPGINIGVGLTDEPALYIDGVEVPSTYYPVEGTLTPNDPVAEGEHDFAYTLTDAAGNESEPSDPITITIDTVAPDAPIAPTDYNDDVAGIIDATSMAAETNDAQPGINIGVGLADDPALYVDGVEVPSTYDAEAGTLTPNDPVADGMHAFTVKLTDAAGNESDQSDPINITIDTLPPPPPVIDATNGDAITGTGEIGATVTISSNETPTRTFTATVVDDGNGVGVWVIDPVFASLQDGVTLTATQSDPAGNASGPTEAIVDADFPLAPTIDPTDGTEISGTGEIGATVTVTTNEDPSRIFTVDVVDDGNGNGVWTIPSSEIDPGLEDGVELTATQTDPAGNTSALDTEVVDAAVPVVTVDALITGLPTPDEPDVTLNGTVTGTGEEGLPLTVTIFDMEGGNVLASGEATFDGNGNWTFESGVPLPEGAFVQATQTDEANNTGVATQVTALDTDGDMIANTIDIDDDNDGIVDTNDGDWVPINFTGIAANLNVQSFGSIDVGGQLVEITGQFTELESASKVGDANGNLGIGRDDQSMGVDAEEGDNFDLNFSQAVRVRITDETGAGNFNSDAHGFAGDEVRLEADGGFTVFDPLDQLIVVSNDGNVLVYKAATTDLSVFEQGHAFEIFTNQEVETLNVQVDGDTLGPIKVEIFGDADTDGDGLINRFDLDSDNGGISDSIEAQFDQPLVVASGNDEDEDGLDDIFDATPNTGALGSVGLLPVDTNGNGSPDFLEGGPAPGNPDGLPVTITSALTSGLSGTGVPFATIQLSNADGDIGEPILVGPDGIWSVEFDPQLAEDLDITATQSFGPTPDATGEATAILELDTDGDGVANSIDIDDDNDGILDVNEVNTSIVANGSFEFDVNGELFGPDQVLNGVNSNSGDDWLEAWDFDTGFFNIVADGTASEGERYIDLGAFVGGFGAGSTLEQDLSLTIGETYTLLFDYRSSDGTENDFSISLEESGAVFESFSTSSTDWITGQITFTAEVEDELLFFDTFGPFFIDPNQADDIGIHLDNIRVGADTDGDGAIDSLDTDSDNGGIPDNFEAQYGQPYEPPSGIDEDGDGLDDAYDENLNGAENSVGLIPADTNSDGIADFLDGQGLPEGEETQPPPVITQALTSGAEGTGIPGANIQITGPGGLDVTVPVDSDGNWSASFDPQIGEGESITAAQTLPGFVGPAGEADATLALDTDGDGIADSVDIDDDDDGILDVNEGPVFDTTVSGFWFDSSDAIETAFTTGNLVDTADGNTGTDGSSGATFGTDDGEAEIFYTLVLSEGQTVDTFELFGQVGGSDAEAIRDYDLEIRDAAGEVVFAGSASSDVGLGANSLDLTGFVLGEGGYSVRVTVRSPFLADPASTRVDGELAEVRFTDGGTPLTFSGAPEPVILDDTDLDGLIDSRDTDSDNGGTSDTVEARHGVQAPRVALFNEDGTPLDEDRDGLNDGFDDDVTDTSAEASVGLIPVDADENGTADFVETENESDIDTDGDGVFNHIDIDDDNDGIIDENDGGLELSEFGAPPLDADANLSLPHLFYDHNNFVGNPNFDQAIPFPGGLENNNIEEDVRLDGSGIFYNPELGATAAPGGSATATAVPLANLSFATAQEALDAGSFIELTFTTTDNPDRVLALSSFAHRNGSFRGNVAVLLDGEFLGEFAVGSTGTFEIPGGPYVLENDTEHTVQIVPFNDVGAGPNLNFAFDSFGLNFERADFELVDGRLNLDTDGSGISDTVEAQYDREFIDVARDEDGNIIEFVDEDGDGLHDDYDLDTDPGNTAEDSVGLTPADTNGDRTPDFLDGQDGTDTLPITVNALFDGSAITGTSVVGATITLTTDEDPAREFIATVEADGTFSVTPGEGEDPFAPGTEVTVVQSDTEHLPEATSSATATLVLDTDLDGVINSIDIDDDNDGILDVDEIDAETQFWFISTDAVITDSRTAFNNPANTADGNFSPTTGLVFNMSPGGNPTPEFVYGLSVATGDTVDMFNLRGNVGTQFAQQVTEYDLEITDLSGDVVFTGSANSDGLNLSSNATNVSVDGLNLGEGLYTVRLLPTAALNPIAAEIAEVSIPGAQTVLEPPEGIELVFDADGDDIINRLDTDSDNGGATDYVEAQHGQTLIDVPRDEDGNIIDFVDEDGDGLHDAYDEDDEDTSNEASVGLGQTDADNNGTADFLETANESDTDSDGDGVFNHVDIDDDNDGILDVDEVDTVGTPLNLSDPSMPAAIMIDGEEVAVTAELVGPAAIGDSNGELQLAQTSAVDGGGSITLTFDEPTVLIFGSKQGSAGAFFDSSDQVTLSSDGAVFTVSDPDTDITASGANSDTVTFSSTNPANNVDNFDDDWTITTSPLTEITISYENPIFNPNSTRIRILSADSVDSDGDGIVNRLDLDSDGNGIGDFDEAQSPGIVLGDNIIQDSDFADVVDSGLTYDGSDWTRVGTTGQSFVSGALILGAGGAGVNIEGGFQSFQTVEGQLYILEFAAGSNNGAQTVFTVTNAGGTVVQAAAAETSAFDVFTTETESGNPIIFEGDGTEFTIQYNNDSDGFFSSLQFLRVREFEPDSILVPSGEDANRDGLDDAFDDVQASLNPDGLGLDPVDTDEDGNPDFTDTTFNVTVESEGVPESGSIDSAGDADSIVFDGAGLTLDLTQVENDVFTNVETIDLTGSGNNALELTLQDLLDLNGDTDELVIDGNLGDEVTALGFFATGATQEINGQTFNEFSGFGGIATLIVNEEVSVNGGG